MSLRSALNTSAMSASHEKKRTQVNRESSSMGDKAQELLS